VTEDRDSDLASYFLLPGLCHCWLPSSDELLGSNLYASRSILLRKTKTEAYRKSKPKFFIYGISANVMFTSILYVESTGTAMTDHVELLLSEVVVVLFLTVKSTV
jgi:hypothetical protein